MTNYGKCHDKSNGQIALELRGEASCLLWGWGCHEKGRAEEAFPLEGKSSQVSSKENRGGSKRDRFQIAAFTYAETGG